MEHDKRQKRGVGADSDPQALRVPDAGLQADETPGAIHTAFVSGWLLLEIQGGESVLDFGCGSGRSSYFLQRLGAKVSGVDISLSAVEDARQKFPEINFELIPNGEAPFAAKTFPKIFSSFVHQDISNLAAMLKFHREVARLLKPDGLYVVIARSDDYIESVQPESPRWSERDIADSLVTAGLGVERIDKLNHAGHLILADDQGSTAAFYLIRARKWG